MDNQKKFDSIYLISLLFVTIGILTGLFFYNKGHQKNLDVTLSLTDDIMLRFYKVSIKPQNDSRNYVNFYVESKNLSNQPIAFYPEKPKNPCDDYYDKFQNYNTCLKSPEYQKYQDELNKYNQTVNNPVKMSLMNPENQSCDEISGYRVNSRYPNIFNSIFSNYQRNENKIGTITFSCPKSNGRSYKLYYSGIYIQDAITKEIQI